MNGLYSDGPKQVPADGFSVFEPSELYTPDVGSWSEDKYKLVKYYADIFSTSMKNRWPNQVYLDLFAGAGEAQLRDSGKIIPTSALLSLDIKTPFTKYIFCDIDEKNIEALKCRVHERYPDIEHTVALIYGDTNQNVQRILDSLPPYSKDCPCLGFCLVDIFKAENLKFKTIEKLASRFFDFLVLIPTGMDIRRNIEPYLNNTVIDEFLDCTLWRDRWVDAEKSGEKPDLFIAKCFGRKMQDLGYQEMDLDKDSFRVKNSKNRILYHLFFYSRHKIGKDFFAEAKQKTTDQINLFD